MLIVDDLVDPGGRPLDLAGLVGHDVVVILLARKLDGGIPLAKLELVGGLRRSTSQTLEEILQRRRDEEDQECAGDLALDDLGALDVDLEDDVATRLERLADLAAGRAVPVAVDLVRLEESTGGPLVANVARSRK